MKKLLSLLIIAMFVVSLSPAVFAVNDNAGGQGAGNSDATPTVTAAKTGADDTADTIAKRVKAQPKERIKNMREKYQEAKERLKQNKAQLRERLANAKEKREQAKAKHINAKGKIEGRKAKLSACKDDESEDCKALRKETRKHTKDYLSGVAEHVLGMIAKTKERVEQSNMPEEQKAEMLANLDSKAEEIAGALEASNELTEESTKEEFQEVTDVIQEAWKGTKDEIKKGAGKVATNKIRALNTRMKQLETKLQKTVERLENAGQDTSVAQTQLDSFKEYLDKSKASEQEAQNKYQAGDTAGAVEKTKESHRYLVEAHKNLKQLVQTIKKAQGGEEALKARNQNREQTGQEDEAETETTETNVETEEAGSETDASDSAETATTEETAETNTVPTADFPDAEVEE